MTFYDGWLAAKREIEEAYLRSPGVSRDADHPWVETPHDARVKLMLSPELGFPTMGGAVLKAEIPVGGHTGLHIHGEEAVHILSGTGFIVIDGRRFDVRPGSTGQIPYRVAHRLVNTGPEPLLYVSAMAFPLERFLNLATLEQLEGQGNNDDELLAMEAEKGHSLPDGRRVIIHLDQAPATRPSGDEIDAYRDQHDAIHYLAVPENGFPERNRSSVAITHVFVEPAGYHGGRHKHLEAVLYVLEGEGYSDVGDKLQPWSAGDILHIPPAMWEHEHYNAGDRPYRLLRIQFGIRYWFTDLWPDGYTPQRIHDAQGRPVVLGRIDGES
jgi:mannose-6-phosphate isomerase-like protein (cupin superfamily)